VTVTPTQLSSGEGVIKTGTVRRVCLGFLLVSLVFVAQCVAPRRPLRIGLVVLPIYEIPVLARALGQLDSTQVQLLDYGSAAAALRAYRNGVVDGVALTTSYVVELLTLSSNDRIVLVIGVSKGGDAMVATPAVREIRQLKGRRIAVESGSLGSLVLSRALEHGGLAKTDVHVVPVDVNGQEAAFNSGAVDAVITYEPLRSTLIERGAHDIFNSSMMPNEIVDVLVVQESATRERQEAIAHLTQAWFQALDYLRRHPADAAARVAPREGVSAHAYLSTLDGVQIFGREENQRWLSGTPAQIDEHLQSLADAMQRAGLLSSPVRVSGVSTGRFIR